MRNEPWTVEEIATLIDADRKHQKTKKTAKQLNRTVGAVTSMRYYTKNKLAASPSLMDRIDDAYLFLDRQETAPVKKQKTLIDIHITSLSELTKFIAECKNL